VPQRLELGHPKFVRRTSSAIASEGGGGPPAGPGQVTGTRRHPLLMHAMKKRRASRFSYNSPRFQIHWWVSRVSAP
jgi:hypothetical protein